jgi:hypothetical protein
MDAVTLRDIEFFIVCLYAQHRVAHRLCIQVVYISFNFEIIQTDHFFREIIKNGRIRFQLYNRREQEFVDITEETSGVLIFFSRGKCAVAGRER